MISKRPNPLEIHSVNLSVLNQLTNLESENGQQEIVKEKEVAVAIVVVEDHSGVKAATDQAVIEVDAADSVAEERVMDSVAVVVIATDGENSVAVVEAIVRLDQ